MSLLFVAVADIAKTGGDKFAKRVPPGVILEHWRMPPNLLPRSEPDAQKRIWFGS